MLTAGFRAKWKRDWPVSRSAQLLLKAPINTAGPSRRSSVFAEGWRRVREGLWGDIRRTVIWAEAGEAANATFSDSRNSVSVFTGVSPPSFCPLKRQPGPDQVSTEPQNPSRRDAASQ